MDLILNKLKGEIPQGTGELPKLNTFQVFNNFLIGTLPPDTRFQRIATNNRCFHKPTPRLNPHTHEHLQRKQFG